MKRVRWNHTQPAPRPDLAIVGVPLPDGRVALYASTELTHAALQLQAEFEVNSRYEPTGSADMPRIELRLGLAGYQVVYAESYADALVDLLNGDWRPPGYHDPATVVQGELVDDAPPLQLEACRG